MSRRRDRRLALAICLGLVLATLAAYWQVGDNGYVDFDDPEYVTQNPRVLAGLTWEGARWAFTASHSNNWHPLTWLAHMLDVELFGTAWGRHHLSAVVLHAASAVVLFLLLRSTTGARWPSALAAALFALHPLQVESVAWLSERKSVLSTLLWLLTLAAYVAYARRPGAARYLLAVVLFALGLLSKPMLVTLPLVLLLLDYWPLGRLLVPARPDQEPPAAGSGGGRRRRQRARARKGNGGIRPLPGVVARLLLEKVPFLVLALGVGLVTLAAQQRVVQTFETFPLQARVANALLAYVRYLGKIVWPSPLAVFYPHTATSLWRAEVIGASVLLIVVTLLVVVLARKGRWRGYLPVGWLWYLGTLVPVIGLVQVGLQSMADRYTYVPAIGIYVILAWGAADLLEGRRFKRSRQLQLAGGALAALALLAVLTRRQVDVWRSSVTLYAHAAGVTEDNYWAHYNLAQAHQRRGNREDALRHFEERLRIEPDHPESLRNVGILLSESGQVSAALEYFARAVELVPDDPFAHRDLGRARANLGRLGPARTSFEAAIRLRPDDPALAYLLGAVLVELGDLEGASTQLQRTLELDPGHAEAHNALGITHARRGELTAAVQHFRAALDIEPRYPEAQRNLEQILPRTGGPTQPPRPER